MSLPGHGAIDEVPDQVVGRAVRDAEFRDQLLDAATEAEVQAAVADAFPGIELSSDAANQILALDRNQVEIALAGVQYGRASLA